MADDGSSRHERERAFDAEELFFSATDARGVILHGNPVFIRVSGYEPDQLFGRPHNLVRHPDMPRAVFRLFWDHLDGGRPVAAYVKNRAQDGSFYWVAASAVPTAHGYLSIRMKPTTAWFDVAKDIYRDVRTVERALEDRGEPRHEVIAAGSARLLARLGAAGFDGYDSFMESFLPAEIAARAALVGSSSTGPSRRERDAGAHGRDDVPAAALAFECRALVGLLDRVFADIDAYVELNEHLSAKTSFLLNLADQVSVVSLNAVIAASRLPGTGGPLGVIAEGMRVQGDRSAVLVRALAGETTRTVQLLRDLGFRVSLAKLQSEMALFFVDELTGSAAGSGLLRSLGGLTECLGTGVDDTAAHLAALDARLRTIDSLVSELLSALRALSFTEINGRIESTRVEGAAAFEALFTQVQSQIATASSELTDLARAATNAGGRRSVVDPDELRSQGERLAAAARHVGAATTERREAPGATTGAP